MRDININVRLMEGSPHLGSTDNTKIIGAMWDNRAQRLVFTRDTAFANYNMMLSFEMGGKQIDVNLGTENTYEITNALTQSSVLKLRLSFYEGTTFLYGSVNTLIFMYTMTAQIGNMSTETINQYLELLTTAEQQATVASTAAEKAEAALASLNDSLDNLFPGGTNILRNTNEGFAVTTSSAFSAGTWNMWATNSGTYEVIDISDAPNPDIKKGIRLVYGAGTIAVSQRSIPLIVGNEYTVSVFARCISGGGTGYIYPYTTGSTAKFITATSEWKRFSYTFTPTDSTANTSLLLAKATEAGTLEYCGMKLELGNKATDWSLSPWDNNAATALWTGSASAGTVITLSTSMDNYRTLIVQLGSPGTSAGLQTLYLRRWLEANWQNTVGGQYYSPCNGGYVLLTFDSDTQITVTTTTVYVRGIFGIT